MLIRTVLGDINATELRHCQCHEHVYTASDYLAKINPILCIDDYDKSLKELQTYYDNGGRCIVDAQPIGCGRRADKLVTLSAESSVNIIASTGFHKLLFYPEDHWLLTTSQSTFTDIMIREIEEGMFIHCNHHFSNHQIEAKAGMIKIACDRQGLDPIYKKYFFAAAMAANKTGVSIQCHIEKPETAKEVTDYLLQCGVDNSSIILAHMDRSTNYLEENIAVAEKGIYLQYDTIGRYKYHSDEEEITLIQEMCNRGYSKNLLMGLDTTRARLLNYGGDIGLSYIRTDFIQKMLENGISREQIKVFFEDNPRKALIKNFTKEVV